LFLQSASSGRAFSDACRSRPTLHRAGRRIERRDLPIRRIGAEKREGGREGGRAVGMGGSGQMVLGG